MSITVDEVKALLGLEPTDTLDDAELAAVVDAANALVSTYLPDLVEPWPANVQQGTKLYAARLYRRRASVEGLAGYEEIGAVLIPAFDPDFERLLGIGKYQDSAFA